MAMPRTGTKDRGDADGSHALLRLTLELPEGVSYITTLRKTACCLLDSVGIRQTDIEDIELLIGELATNAVLHAKGSDGYRVDVEVHSDRVVLTVVDRGQGFSAASIPAPGESRSDPQSQDHEERFGGWGLPLVYSIADQVQITPTQPHGTTVRAEKRLQSLTNSQDGQQPDPG